MEAKTQKRFGFIINIVFIALIIGLTYLFFKYLFWPASPFIISFFLAVCLQKPLRFLDRKTNKKCHGLFSILLVLGCLLLVLFPVTLIFWKIGDQISSFIHYILDLLSDLPTFLQTVKKALLSLVSSFPEGIQGTLTEKINSIFISLSSSASLDLSKLGINSSSVTSGISSGLSSVFSVVKNVPSILLVSVIGIIAWIYFTKDYNYVVRFITKQLPVNKKNVLVEFKQIFSSTIMKLLKAYGIIMFITFCELALGLQIMKWIGILDTSFVFLIALAIAIFDILPVAGSGGILIPWTFINAVLGNYKLALGLIIIYVVISIIRQYIEPKIVGNSLGVHPLVTLAGLYFGLKLFGFIGMFLVPLTIMTIKAFNDTGRIQIWKTAKRN